MALRRRLETLPGLEQLTWSVWTESLICVFERFPTRPFFESRRDRQGKPDMLTQLTEQGWEPVPEVF